MTKLMLTGAILAASLLAMPAFAAEGDNSSSGAQSTTTASESSLSGNLGTGFNQAGAQVTSTNQAFDNSFASVVGATLNSGTTGGDQASITGMSFSHGAGFDIGTATQTGSSTGSDTGSAFAHQFHH